jgi:hypothetical protein|tara:strand:+ start:656 stop:937 length:282 start_codon:yes stop_codon:yes gene_type:complete
VTPDDGRLRAIEAQLVRMNDKFDNIIRLEEKHNGLSDRVDGLGDRVHKQGNIIMELQQTSLINSKTLGGYERFLWVGVSAFFALCTWVVRDII